MPPISTGSDRLERPRQMADGFVTVSRVSAQFHTQKTSVISMSPSMAPTRPHIKVFIPSSLELMYRDHQQVGNYRLTSLLRW